ncbi:hypothetical protein LEP1GSC081_0698 [Leptospira kirschneri str. H1]|uniref:Uncharacterized protein n=1 Tax=Leptospira kirschneri str. H1 TaxID=1049966 RepID=A0A0E2B3P0_9LEPT|nr:hypothetical protein LEP1GSC081_0698 [Leptospira kirschneri str. H1]
MQKVCFSDKEKSSELLHLQSDPWDNAVNLRKKKKDKRI